MRPPAGSAASVWAAAGSLSSSVRVLPLVTRKMLSGCALWSKRRTWPFRSTVTSRVIFSPAVMVMSAVSLTTPLALSASAAVSSCSFETS